MHFMVGLLRLNTLSLRLLAFERVLGVLPVTSRQQERYVVFLATQLDWVVPNATRSFQLRPLEKSPIMLALIEKIGSYDQLLFIKPTALNCL